MYLIRFLSIQNLFVFAVKFFMAQAHSRIILHPQIPIPAVNWLIVWAHTGQLLIFCL